MAKSTTKGPKKQNLKQFPGSAKDSTATATAVAEPPEPPESPEHSAEPPTPFDGITDESAAEKPRKIPKVLTFFQRVASIDPADWGLRAKIKVYRLAPLINRLVGTENKFITIYAEPISEQKLKVDHGSGRYRLYLNFKNPGGQGERELDTVEIDILDPAFPPKINPGEWMDDPRNKQWAWAKPPDPAHAPIGPAPLDPLAAFGTFMDIQDRMAERQPLAVATPSAPEHVDPWTAAEKILQMRSDNPMVTILMGQLDGMQKSAEAARDREFKAQEAAREREFQLQEELRKLAAAPAQSKSLVDQIVELASVADKLEPVKKLFGLNGSNNGEPGTARASRTTGLDLTRDIALKLFDSPVGEGLGQLLASFAHRNANGASAQPMNGNPAVVQTQETPEAEFARFIETVLNPALLAQYAQGFDGAAFAQWLYDGYPDRLVQFQNFTHPRLPGLRGASAIITGYKNTANMWPTLRLRGEEAFIQFVTEFCAWKPEAEGPEDTGVIDLDNEQEARVS